MILSYEGVSMASGEEDSKPFTYNLDRLKECVNSKTTTKPKGLRGKELTKWLISH